MVVSRMVGDAWSCMVPRMVDARPPGPGDCGDEVIASGQKASRSMSNQLRAYRRATYVGCDELDVSKVTQGPGVHRF